MFHMQLPIYPPSAAYAQLVQLRRHLVRTMGDPGVEFTPEELDFIVTRAELIGARHFPGMPPQEELDPIIAGLIKASTSV